MRGVPNDTTALVLDARDAPLPDLGSKKGTAFPEEDDPPLVTRNSGGKSNATDARGKEDAEYDDNIEAPSPPEMRAARFERGGSCKKMKLDGEEDDDDIDDDIEAPPPPEMMVARFKRGGSSKKMKLEGEEDDDGIEDEEGAPRLPDMIAASYEGIDAVDRRREARDKAVPPETNRISDGEERMRMACDEWAEWEEVRIKREIGRLREIDDDGTSAIVNAREGRVDPSSLLDRTCITAPNDDCGASTNILTQRDRDDDASHAAGGGVHADIQSHTTYERDEISPLSSRPGLSAIDPRDRSLPLLEATLVPDLFNKPVYIYVNANARDDDERTVYDAVPVSPGWRSNNKRTVIVLGSVTLVAIIAASVAVAVAIAGRSPREPPVSVN